MGHGPRGFPPHCHPADVHTLLLLNLLLSEQLQVFPAVDVAFLTTYLVSIASQLDLRSPSAIRLISDFLSEQDAQHLVHEISTFARSPFTSLEGYDRFVQYGRPPRRESGPNPDDDHHEHDHKEEEEEPTLDDEQALDRPRFEEHMRRQKPPGHAEGPGPMRPWGHHTHGPGSVEFPGRGYGPRRNQEGRPVPPEASGSLPPLAGRGPSQSCSVSAPPFPHGPPRRRRPPLAGRPHPAFVVEPDWRERDQRYTGSYYASSESRWDQVRAGGGRQPGPLAHRSRHEFEQDKRPPPSFGAAVRDGHRDFRDLFESRARPRQRSPSLLLLEASDPLPGRRRRRVPSVSPSRVSDPLGYPFDSDGPHSARGRHRDSTDDDRELSPPPRSKAKYHHDSTSSTTSSPPPLPRKPSRSPPSPLRARSPRPRSRTPSRRGSLTPPPPPDVGAASTDTAVDSELDDAISLVGPTFSIGAASSRETTPASPLTPTAAVRPISASRPEPTFSSTRAQSNRDQKAARPTLAIFGAARRLLGNGRVVTFSRDGRRASLQPLPPPAFASDGPARPGVSAFSEQRARARVVPPRQQEPHVRARPNPFRGRGADAATPTVAPDPAARGVAIADARTALLDRVGGIASPTSSTISSAPASPPASEPDAVPAVPNRTGRSADLSSLRARLQARLTAEYRHALAASRSSGSGCATAPTLEADTATTNTSPAVNKSELRKLLQSRLQAEKALAYEDLVRSRAAAPLPDARTAASHPDSAAMGLDGPTVFSQATRDLLLARLEEERSLVRDEAERADTATYGTHVDKNGPIDGDYGLACPGHLPKGARQDDGEAASVASSTPTPPARKTESGLRAALLAKRQATIQDELKTQTGELKEMMMQRRVLEKRRSSGGNTGDGAGAGRVAS